MTNHTPLTGGGSIPCPWGPCCHLTTSQGPEEQLPSGLALLCWPRGAGSACQLLHGQSPASLPPQSPFRSRVQRLSSRAAPSDDRGPRRKLGSTSLAPGSHLFHYHSELALGAEHRLDPRQPLDTGEDLGWADEHLTRVEAVGIVKEEALRDSGWEKSPCEQYPSGDSRTS